MSKSIVYWIDQLFLFEKYNSEIVTEVLPPEQIRQHIPLGMSV